MPDPTPRLNAALAGRYSIERQLGEGGMATVYLARDERHDRHVALKVLKPELAAVVGADRFLAEIRTTANLQHPNILPLFDSGEADSFLFYVMPYVQGESLRERLERERQLPVDDAVQIARTMAEALEYAHQQGVIHRDIKPANVLMLSGKPVIADFGIALAVGAAGGGRLTETGLSVGTPHYMSPEQATGDAHVGPATDIYALGCVLYEMLVGDPPHVGSTAQAVLGKIILGDVDRVTKHRRAVPPNVEAAVFKALEKVPADRFREAQDLAKALADPGFRYGTGVGAAAAFATSSWNRLSLGLTAAAGIAISVAIWSLLRPPPPGPVAWLEVPFEEGETPRGPLSSTADGSAIVYAGPGPGGEGTQLWIRRWAELRGSPIEGTGGAIGPVALSPDGGEVAFLTGPIETQRPVRVVSLEGGPSRRIGEGASRLLGWARDGWVYFQAPVPDFGIRRVRGEGGAVETLVGRDGGRIPSWVELLPGGDVLLYQMSNVSAPAPAEIWALDLGTGGTTKIVDGSSPRAVPTGHLLFGTDEGELMAAPIDPSTGQLEGTPLPVAGGLWTSPYDQTMDYRVSQAGDLIYRSGPSGGDLDRPYEFVWITRSGDISLAAPGFSFVPGGEANAGWQLSSDDSRVVYVGVVDGSRDIFVKALPDGPERRLTVTSSESEMMPRWTPDGQSVTFVSRDLGLFRTRVDGAGEAQLVYDQHQLALGFYSPNEEWLILRQSGSLVQGVGARNILARRAGVDGPAAPLVADSAAVEQAPALSPDGRWLAYTISESGVAEVRVRPFPSVQDGLWEASRGGGSKPLWAHSGRELLFYDPTTRQMFALPFEVTESTDSTPAAFTAGVPVPLFTVPPGYLVSDNADFYDVSTDDQRFLMARPYESGGAAPSVIRVQNFLQVLRERMGGG